MDASRSRLDHLRRDPRVSLTVLDKDDWYSHVSLFGVVERMVDDPELADIDRLALRYQGRPYRNRTSKRVSAWVRPSAGTAGTEHTAVSDASWRRDHGHPGLTPVTRVTFT